MVRKELRDRYKPLSGREESQVVVNAKSRDPKACARLFHSISGLALKAHYSSHGATSVAEQLGELYLVFLRCVDSFEPCRGLRFTTWFGCKAGFAMKESVRAKARRDKREKGGRSVESGTDYDLGEIHNDATPWAADNMEYPDVLLALPNQVSLQTVIALFPAGGPEQELLMALCGIGRTEPVSQSEVAKEWGCTRQNISSMMKRIALRAVNELG